MRVYVRVELFEKRRKRTKKGYFPEPDATFGKWIDFDVLPRVGEEIIFNRRNFDVHRSTVEEIGHWLSEDDDDVLAITLTCREDNLELMGDCETPGWHYHRDYLVQDGFQASDDFWEEDK